MDDLTDMGRALRSPAAGVALAVAACLLSYAVRSLLNPVFPQGFPFIVFFPAVIATAYLAGRIPGLVSAGLSAIMAWYFFIIPESGPAMTAGVMVALAFFVVIAAFIVLLITHLQNLGRSLEAERDRSARLFAQERVLFQELQHRVANNMQFVAGLLHMQTRYLSDDPAAAATALGEASRRIEVMARVHRRLYDASAIDTPLPDYVAEICADVIAGSGVTGIEPRIEVVPVRLDLNRLMLLSLIIAELVTNCLKHAFVGRSRGTIHISLAMPVPDQLELAISDDGVGLPAVKTPRAGLGTQILRGLAAQLGGQISLTGGDGTTARLRFPLRGATAA